MALADILAAIQAGADQEQAAIEVAAGREAADTRARALRSAAEERERLARSRHRAAAVTADRIVNQAQLQADREVRAAAEQVYQEVRSRSLAQLSGVRGSPDYPRILGELMEECRAVLPEGTSFHVDAADREAARAIVTEHGWDDCSVVADLNTTGGVVAAAGDGRYVRNTFETRMERADRHARLLVFEMMPGRDGGS